MSKLVSCSASGCIHKIVLVLFSLGIVLASFAASSLYADSESPQPPPLPSSPPHPQPTAQVTPHPQPVTVMRYEGITSQGQPLTLWVEQGVLTSISIGIQTGTYSSYTATYHGHLARILGNSFDVTLSNEKEWLHITGNLSVGTYGEPPQGNFHFIGTFSVSDYIPNTEVAGTWRLGRPAPRFVPMPTHVMDNQAYASPSLSTDEQTTRTTDESKRDATIENATPRFTPTSTPTPTPSLTSTESPNATTTASPTSTSINTPTPISTKQADTSTATATATPSGTPSSSPTSTPTRTPTPTSASSPGSARASLSLGIKGEELAFDKDTLTVTIEPGNTITFTFTNTSMTQKHSWVLLNHNDLRKAEHFVDAAMSAGDTGSIPVDDSALMNTVLASIEPLQPGKRKTITFSAPAPGEYLYICTMPGHFVAGDHGVLTVKAP